MESIRYYFNGFRKKSRYFFSYERKELLRIKKIPRYQNGNTNLFGFEFEFVDSASFRAQYFEIFSRQIYNFKAENDQPYIIDCGSNIGVSILYFKKIYPNAHIVGFEPDKNVFLTLKKNVANSTLKSISLLNKGIWNNEGKVSFNEEGADGGSILDKKNQHFVHTKKSEIEVVSLRQYLNKPVDFLKIDIEGAESVLLEDCNDLIKNVQRIFIEFHSKIGCPQKLDSILNILTINGFRYYIESGSIANIQPFVKRGSLNNYDNLLSIFAYKNSAVGQ